ncbi:hypothetical protein CQW23_16635 [Capsicum baccatum]|uniref:Uncharacterized protein n=1 Tax=Capsicum baccatum TaxID=33114 RepID=A0A2G2WBX2_CAPBA|nr:hypothetical protein CQW23_16635 [Capsicum baccatum]
MPNNRENLGKRPQGYDQWNTQSNRDQDMGINSIKVSHPNFKCESDLEVYHSWESSGEKIYQVNEITKENKSFYAIGHNEGYGNMWQNYLKRFGNALNNGQPPPWNTLKGLMRQRLDEIMRRNF